MKKTKFVAWLVILAMVITMLPATVFAADIEADDPDAVSIVEDVVEEQVVAPETKEVQPTTEEAVYGEEAAVDDTIIIIPSENITNRNRMFKVETASAVENTDGTVLLTIQMSAAGYHYFFKGTKDEAIANGDKPETWIAGTPNAEGKYVFQLPLTADEIDKYVSFVSISNTKYEEYKEGKGSFAAALYGRRIRLNLDEKTLLTDDWLDPAPAQHVDELIAKIQSQKFTSTTWADCEAAKAAWDALTKDEKELVEEADYFGLDTGDASKDDPLNADGIGENEILVVSFGTSFNDNRVETIGAIEKAIAKAYPDWSVRRAFTAQIIINHIYARDGEKTDNVEQALDRAVANGVKNLVVQPTHLMHGEEYDELIDELAPYTNKMSILVSEPLLGEVGEAAADVNTDKIAVAKAVVAAACSDAGYKDAAAAEADGAAIVLMGHGTAHPANITYEQMQTVMNKLGYGNVFIGTVEGLPESTECEAVIARVAAAGYKKVFLRPLMVVAGDHANNDMADPDDDESWYSMFTATGNFDSVDCQIKGLGELKDVQDLYVAHLESVIPETIASITNKNSMFKVVKAVAFKAATGGIILEAEMSGSGYHYMYKGTKAEAIANGDKPETWIAGKQNAEGKWVFQIPFDEDELDGYVPIVSISDKKYNEYKEGKGTLEDAFFGRQFKLNLKESSLVTGDWVDPAPAQHVDELIAKIQSQKFTSTTWADCEAAKAAWDALSEDEKELVEEADYFGLDTGDASKDDPLNADGIGENEILVVSFGTSFNDNRAATIGAIEKAIAKAYPNWSVRRAFTAQIIINHIYARDGIKIDNVEQALDRAVANGVKKMIVQPTHLMHGEEYDELQEALAPYKDQIVIVVTEPLLGEVGETAADVNTDKIEVAKAVVAAACADAGYKDAAAAEADGAAIVLMGHGTAHPANITYEQMQTVMNKLGYGNVFIGTVEGLPESTECEAVIARVAAAGYKKVFLRPLMVVAGDHANNDMADPDDDESWYSMFTATGNFDSVECQIKGLGELKDVQDLYVYHVNEEAPMAQTIKATAKASSTDYATLAKKAQTFDAITVKGAKTTLSYAFASGDKEISVNAKNGKITIAKGTNAGTYTAKIKVTAAATEKYEAAETTVTVKVTVKQSKQPMVVKATKKTQAVKYNKTKKQTIKNAVKVTKNQGTLTYKISNTKYFSISKKGVITVKAGTPKNSYKVTVTVTAKGNKNYKKGSGKATFTIKVK